MHVPRGNKKGHAVCVTLGLDVAGQPTLTVGTNLLAPLRRVKGKWRGRCVLSALLSLGLLGALAGVRGRAAAACEGKGARPVRGGRRVPARPPGRRRGGGRRRGAGPAPGDLRRDRR